MWRRSCKDPGEPTVEERQRHELTHCPMRSWCKYCIMGRGKEADKRRGGGNSEGLKEIHIDYCFPKTEGGSGIITLVARERETRMTMATVVPKKGAVGDFAARD